MKTHIGFKPFSIPQAPGMNEARIHSIGHPGSATLGCPTFPPRSPHSALLVPESEGTLTCLKKTASPPSWLPGKHPLCALKSALASPSLPIFIPTPHFPWPWRTNSSSSSSVPNFAWPGPPHETYTMVLCSVLCLALLNSRLLEGRHAILFYL